MAGAHILRKLIVVVVSRRLLDHLVNVPALHYVVARTARRVDRVCRTNRTARPFRQWSNLPTKKSRNSFLILSKEIEFKRLKE